ncbi:UBA-like [Trinorchestia longiramus]|nr:UBA-like [Trinorchestia longiramus]
MKMESMNSINSALDEDVVEVYVRSCNQSGEYVLAVPSSTPVKQIKQMAVGHFDTPAANFPRNNGAHQPQLLLLHAQSRRRLADESSLALENIPSGADLLLLEDNSRMSTSMRIHLDSDPTLTNLRQMARARGLLMNHMTGLPPSEGEIRHATSQLPSCPRVPEPSRCSCNTIEVHGKLLLLRRIMMGVAHSSLRLLGGARDTQDAFIAILDKLERRHRSSMKPASIKKLKDMGFSEPKAVIALKCKSSVEEAAEWLAENDPHEHLPPAPHFADLTEEDDPVVVLMPRFWHFRRLFFVLYVSLSLTSHLALRLTTPYVSLRLTSHYALRLTTPYVSLRLTSHYALRLTKLYIKRHQAKFVQMSLMPQPQPAAYRRLVELGHDPTRAFDALMQTENDEIHALQVLETERRHDCDLLYTAPPAHHPIMTSIFGASVVQVSLQKPKVLYALLALCANPNNANLWLSDPDTSGVVNLVLKLYHEERFNIDCYCGYGQKPKTSNGTCFASKA